MDEKDIRDRLDAMREELGSWYAVAKKLGVTQQYMARYYNERIVGPKLVKALGLETRYVRAK